MFIKLPKLWRQTYVSLGVNRDTAQLNFLFTAIWEGTCGTSVKYFWIYPWSRMQNYSHCNPVTHHRHFAHYHQFVLIDTDYRRFAPFLRYLPSSLLNSIADLFRIYLWFIQRSFKQIITQSVSFIVPLSTMPSRQMQAFCGIKLRDTIKWTVFVPYNDRMTGEDEAIVA